MAVVEPGQVEVGAGLIMVMADTAGEAVHVQFPGLSPILDRINRSTDEEILAVFARILRELEIPAKRAAKILRTEPDEFARFLATPLPEGLGDGFE